MIYWHTGEQHLLKQNILMSDNSFPIVSKGEGIPVLHGSINRNDLVIYVVDILLRWVHRKIIGLCIYPGIYFDNCVCRFTALHHAISRESRILPLLFFNKIIGHRWIHIYPVIEDQKQNANPGLGFFPMSTIRSTNPNYYYRNASKGHT